MRQYAREAQDMLRGHTLDSWMTDPIRRYAIERVIEIIGEAANHVSDGFQQAHPELPWGTMIGMRNVIAHNYSTIDIDKLWSAATDGTAALLVVLEPLLGQDPDVPDV
jgi:uncharacterized protein with HEPN domain